MIQKKIVISGTLLSIREATELDGVFMLLLQEGMSNKTIQGRTVRPDS